MIGDNKHVYLVADLEFVDGIEQAPDIGVHQANRRTQLRGTLPEIMTGVVNVLEVQRDHVWALFGRQLQPVDDLFDALASRHRSVKRVPVGR